jgi:membrane protein
MLINPDKVRLADVYRLFVFGGAAADLGAAKDLALTPMTLDSGALARQVESALDKGLEQTLAEHFGAAQPAAR